MKVLALLISLTLSAWSTTLSVVPIYEPISLHNTDVDDAVSGSGEPLQAAVMPRPMVLSGAFPETLVDAIRTPHEMPCNDPNYDEDEVNLLELCHIGISPVLVEDELVVSLDISKVSIPEPLELTIRQVLELTLKAVRLTLEVYQKPQADTLKVSIRIEGAVEGAESLKNLECRYELTGS